jgi:hypothetical protein
MAYPRREPPSKSGKDIRLDALEEYRKSIEDDRRQSQDDFDKAIMTLSASGLGVTLAFLDKIVPFGEATAKGALYLIWLYWGASLTCTVCSFFCSTQALIKAERQIADEWNKVYAEGADVKATQDPGGKWNYATILFNTAAALLFVSGTLALLIFMWYNLAYSPMTEKKQKPVNEGQTVAARPPTAAPVTKGLPVAQRPPQTEAPKKSS